MHIIQGIIHRRNLLKLILVSKFDMIDDVNAPVETSEVPSIGQKCQRTC